MRVVLARERKHCQSRCTARCYW